MGQEYDDYGEPAPPQRPVRMAAVLVVAGFIVAWCIFAVIMLARAAGR